MRRAEALAALAPVLRGFCLLDLRARAKDFLTSEPSCVTLMLVFRASSVQCRAGRSASPFEALGNRRVFQAEK